jgi:hypothetical protein
MNERIKELITQAGGHWNHGDFNMPSSVEFQEQDIAKFAELIVQECAGLLQKEAESSHDEGSPSYNVLLQESNWMKRYFGVEE